MNNRNPRPMNSLLFPIAMLVLFIFMFSPMLRGSFSSNQDAYKLEDFQRDLASGEVQAVVITPNRDNDTGFAVVTRSDNERKILYATQIAEVEKIARESGIEPTVKDIPSENTFMTSVLPTVLVVAICLLFFYLMNAQTMGGGGSNAKMMNFGKSKARLTNESGVTLNDVAGLKEEKEDLEEIIDFLKDPGKFTRLGARIPKGVLLEGAPGTGKTLLAKAVAGEAGVPFFSISGSDFVEMFVGVGASRVRDMFDEAKKNSPCIVFIDEIDAVARRRGTGLGGSHDEREQTLNQLLVEMDGFGVNEGIIVMAATNRVDVLDPAILRPGRFDRKISVGRPDIKGREDILKVHSKDKPLSEDVDLKEIARTTAGFSGADLENLMNEAAIGAARADRSGPELYYTVRYQGSLHQGRHRQGEEEPCDHRRGEAHHCFPRVGTRHSLPRAARHSLPRAAQGGTGLYHFHHSHGNGRRRLHHAAA